MKKVIVYKAICNDGVRKYSCSYSYSVNPPPELIVEYKLNEWVSPKIPNTHLFAYKSLDEAKIYPYNDIYEAEAIAYDYPRLFMGNFDLVLRKIAQMQKLLKNKKGIKNFIQHDLSLIDSRFVNCVVGCKKIKLLRKVYGY